MTPQVQTQEPRGPVVERTVPFTPTKVDVCGDNYIITGSLGELAKLTRDGKLIEEYSIPFPSSITHSTTLGDFWIGIKAFSNSQDWGLDTDSSSGNSFNNKLK